MAQDIQRILDLIGGVIFIWPPLFKTDILSKYTTLTSWIRTRIMPSPWLILWHDDRTVFDNGTGIQAARHNMSATECSCIILNDCQPDACSLLRYLRLRLPYIELFPFYRRLHDGAFFT